MGILGQKSKGVSQNKADDVNNIKLIERPRICGIDLSAETISTLKKNGLNVYPGTLGNKVKVPNLFKNQNHKLLLDYDFPKNLHE